MRAPLLGRMVPGPLLAAAAVALIAVSPTSSPRRQWRYFVFEDGAFTSLSAGAQTYHVMAPPEQTAPHRLAPDGAVSASVLADVTGDGEPEGVFLVWRPWQDWPIQEWVPSPSPVTGFHDAAGESCHMVLLDPATGREIWVGSALPVPLLALAVGDVNGDGRNDVVTLEGDYGAGRSGPAHRVDVWSWREFGFRLEWRSEPIEATDLRLFGDGRSGILAIGVR